MPILKNYIMLNKFIIIFYKARTDIPTERELLKEISIIFYSLEKHCKNIYVEFENSII